MRSQHCQWVVQSEWKIDRLTPGDGRIDGCDLTARLFDFSLHDQITGQYWSLDWTSTFKSGGAQCPPGGYDFLNTEGPPTKAPGPGGDAAAGLGSQGMLILSTLAAGFFLVAL